MSIPYSAGTAFTTATCVKAWIEYPFANNGDSATKVYHHTMQVDRLSYSPLAFNDVMTTADEKPTRSPFADDSAAYWVGDTPPSDIGGTLVEFQRIFSNIPAIRVEGNGIYAFTYPGVDSTTTSTIATSTGNESTSFDSGTGEGIMIFDVAPGDTSKFTVGQKLHVNNDNQGFGLFEGQSPSTSWVPYEVNDGFVTDITSNTITVKETLSPAGFIGFRSGVAITTYTLQETLPARDPFTQNATSRRSFSYVKSDDLLGVTIGAKFSLVNSSGVPTDTLTTTTVPTKATYLGYVTDSEYLAAESTQVTRWMGNIWQKESILVQAL